MKSQRISIKIAGESGQGINSIGEVVAKSLKESGLYTFGYREYPSLIKGGFASHQVEVSDKPVSSPSKEADILLCFSRSAISAYLSTVKEGGCLVHSIQELHLTDAQQAEVLHKKIQFSFVPAMRIALEVGGKAIMANTVMVGVLWRVLGLDLEPVVAVLKAEFADKPDVIKPNLECLKAGFTTEAEGVTSLELHFSHSKKRGEDALLSGNQAISLGAVAAGVRAYFAYPMTPSSAILSYLASISEQTGMLVKQAEDEISVAQLAVGAMFMGTRALVATSGGGFDLMTETVSLAGMTETPFVCIIGQRPGPATGLPTWTSAGDLNLAVYAGHGEFPRCVLAVSDPASAYTLIQQAFTLAETMQIPVLVLTEKQIGESLFQLDELPKDMPIERGVVADADCETLTAHDRYAITESGVSPRWFPGQSNATFNANSDEHLTDGSLTEASVPSQAMYDKRLRKMITLYEKLPEPTVIGSKDSEYILVGWGSTKNVVSDVFAALDESIAKKFSYMHYEYMYPLRTEKITKAVESGKKVVLIENNALGQLGGLITQTTGIQFEQRLLKYDGRPFFVEEVQAFLESLA